MTHWTSRFPGAKASPSTLLAGAAHAEVAELRISEQFGIGYLPLRVARLAVRRLIPGIEGLYLALCMVVTASLLAVEHHPLAVLGILAIQSLALWLLFLHLVRRSLSVPLARLTAEVGDIGIETGGTGTPAGGAGHMAELEDAVREMGRRVKFEFRTLIENSVQGMAILQDGRVRFSNRSAAVMLGFSRPEELVLLHSVFDLLPEADRTRANRLSISLQARPGAHACLTIPLRPEEGAMRWVQLQLQQVQWRGRSGLLASLTDVSRRKQLEEKLQHLATYDALTGAVNRRHFLDQATVEIDRSRRHRRPLALLLLDLDYFKGINDRFGHAAGDLALKQVATAVLRQLRDIDILARMGGEEFAVLLPETELEGATTLAERLRAVVEDLSIFAGHEPLPLSVSIGVADGVGCYGETIGEALKRVDMALYRAKREGRNRVEIGSPARPPFAGDGI